MRERLVKVKGVFFDAGDTLFHVKGSVGAVYAGAAERFGVRVDPGLIQRRFLSAWKRMPPLAFPGVERGEVPTREKQWWKALVEEVFGGIAVNDFDRFFEAVYAAFEGNAGWDLFPETRTVLAHLRNRGYRLGIISNFDSRIFTLCEKLQIREFFEEIVISTHAGEAKPSPGIFRSALARFSLAPEEAAYVGDSPAHDLAGARAVGMVPILIDREGRYPEETGIRLGNLEPLVDLFK